MNNKTETEIWKPYPPITWIYGSNLGNVKTVNHYMVSKSGKKHLVKGRDLKQYCERSGYMRVTLAVNGKTIHLSVHRIIATCFILNPENLEQVNHKNCDRANNHVWNLEWVSHLENIAYREKYGVPAAESTKVLRKSLFAVDLKTGKILHFASQHEAERELGVDQRNISMVIKGKRLRAGGYYFSENEDKITKEKLQEIKYTKYFWGGVIAIDIKIKEPLRFKTRAEAANSLGCCASGIGAVIAGKQKQIKGHWFCHADNQAVEKTRSKFGDEIAGKVKELMEP